MSTFSNRTIDYDLAVTFTPYKMIDRLTKQFSKYESHDNNKEFSIPKKRNKN
jgi:hypothetical protein